jgi:hypothetical protein
VIDIAIYLYYDLLIYINIILPFNIAIGSAVDPRVSNQLPPVTFVPSLDLLCLNYGRLCLEDCQEFRYKSKG